LKKGGLGGAILLAAVLLVLSLNRTNAPPRAPPASSPQLPPQSPDTATPEPAPEIAVVVVAEKPPAPGGGSLSLEIKTEDDTAPEAVVTVEPFFEQAGGKRRLETKGGATLEGLAPEWNRVRIVARGYAPVFLPLRLHPGGPVEATVVLEKGATLSGTVRTEIGAPVPGATVRSIAWGSICAATTDADGAYRIEHLPAGRVGMEAQGVGGQALAFLELEEGKESRWDPVLRPAHALSGRVVEEDGTPVGQARVCCSWAVGTETEISETHTDADGVFRFEHCRECAWAIEVWRPGLENGIPADVSAHPSDSPVTITLPRGEGYVRGTVVDRNGAPAVGASIRVWPASRPYREVRARAAADGSFRAGPLPPGAYLVELHLDGEPTRHLRPEVQILADETLDLGVVRFPVGGKIRASVVGMAGGVLPSEDVEVLSLDGSIRFAGEKDGPTFLSEELGPGTYLVRARWRGLVEEVSLAAGGIATVELRVRSGGKLTVLATQQDGQRVTVTFRVEDAKGRVLRDHATYYQPPFLAEGDWRVIAFDERGRRAEASVRMGQEDQTVVLVLE
jgi:protocatechuate 3,4-dioxygenase beta subunit